jgi:putative membrane protein
MDKSRIQALALAAGVVLAAGACNRNPDVPPPKPTATPTVPEPANPAAVPTPPPAPTASPTAEPTAGPISGSDRSFISEAMSRGLAEVEASRLVASKGADAKVKSFAEKLQKDHSDANAKLERIAGSKGMAVSTTIDPVARGKLDALEKLSGADLDRKYLESFGASAHQETIALFERSAREAQDPDVKAFAEEALGTLRSHLEMAQQLQPGTSAAASR